MEKDCGFRVLTLFLLAVVLVAFLVLAVVPNINKDVVSPISVINPGGSKTALVVYQPGYTSFPKDISYAFANGLASKGWRVEITTASSQTPSKLSAYSLLVLGFPIYGGVPGTAIERYTNRTTNLNGINTVIIALGGMNSAGRSVDTMKQKVQTDNGTFCESVVLFSEDGSASAIARQDGSKITP